ncbi:MAG TPA: hypothetical protein V6C97_11575 [Oculatellaceae cyanobacterium]
MRRDRLFAYLTSGFATAILALPVGAQVPWDMVPTSQVAPEYQQPQFQSPVNPSALGGYSLAAPQSTTAIYPTQGTALNSGGATGTLGNITAPTGGYRVIPNVSNATGTQRLNLPQCGTMGLAPVFGTGNDGFTSPGGYTPPMINIPGVGSYRIPQTFSLPGGGSLQVPTQQLLQNY